MSATRPSPDVTSLEEASRSIYSALAKEYYDERHSTTRNFDLVIDLYLLNNFHSPATTSQWPWLDVGCGHTRLKRVIGPDNLVLLDSSIEMLHYSFRPPEPRLRAAVGSAFALPFKANSFSGVFASLGDPFTHPAYFAEARRVLVHGGRLVHIVPSQEWGFALRKAQGISVDRAHFFRGASDCFAPSFLYSESDLSTVLISSGFTDIVTESLFLPRSLARNAVSPDIELSASAQAKNVYDLPILTIAQGRADESR